MGMILFAAPHRFLFLIGASQLMLTLLWWTFILAGQQPNGGMTGNIPVALLHAPLLMYLALPPLFFGFLLTVFPRWMGYPDLRAVAYVPTGTGFALAALLIWAGLMTGNYAPLVGGFLVALLTSLWGMAMLLRVALREQREGKGPTWHAWSILAAFGAGLFAQMALLGFLWSLNPLYLIFAIRAGLHLFLMPVFLTVCHRMLPFFASNVVQGYKPWRPLWLLGCIWIGILLLLSGEIIAVSALRISGAALLTSLTGIMLWKWWPRGQAPALLWILVFGFAWAPAGYALALLDSSGIWLGRAPEHALTIGFAGSLIVAMVTRVTQGHAGRPLLLPVTGYIAFAGLQLAAILRIGAALADEQPGILVISSAIMVITLAPWTMRNALIYMRGRLDGKAG